MALASSSSAAPRQLARLARRPAPYAEPDLSPSPAPSPSTSASAAAYAPPSPSAASLTAPAAQAYLTDLLALPAPLPAPLALQALTHKSFRFAHRVRAPPYAPAELAAGYAPHNARLAFLGRRAAAAYAAVWLHEAALRTGGLAGVGHQRPRAAGAGWAAGEGGVGGVDGEGAAGEGWTAFWGERSVEDRLAALLHASNLGREVGAAWRVADVMRWDGNDTSREGGAVSVAGTTVEAILGALYTQLGSPAAHRAFHAHVLPHLARQLRAPQLVDEAERARVAAGRV